MAKARSSSINMSINAYIGRLIIGTLKSTPTPTASPTAKELVNRAERLYNLNAQRTKQKSVRVTAVVGWLLDIKSENKFETKSKYITNLILDDVNNSL